MIFPIRSVPANATCHQSQFFGNNPEQIDDANLKALDVMVRLIENSQQCTLDLWVSWCREGELNPQDPKVGGF